MPLTVLSAVQVHLLVRRLVPVSYELAPWEFTLSLRRNGSVAWMAQTEAAKLITLVPILCSATRLAATGMSFFSSIEESLNSGLDALASEYEKTVSESGGAVASGPAAAASADGEPVPATPSAVKKMSSLLNKIEPSSLKSLEAGASSALKALTPSFPMSTDGFFPAEEGSEGQAKPPAARPPKPRLDKDEADMRVAEAEKAAAAAEARAIEAERRADRAEKVAEDVESRAEAAVEEAEADAAGLRKELAAARAEAQRQQPRAAGVEGGAGGGATSARLAEPAGCRLRLQRLSGRRSTPPEEGSRRRGGPSGAAPGAGRGARRDERWPAPRRLRRRVRRWRRRRRQGRRRRRQGRGGGGTERGGGASR